MVTGKKSKQKPTLLSGETNLEEHYAAFKKKWSHNTAPRKLLWKYRKQNSVTNSIHKILNINYN